MSDVPRDFETAFERLFPRAELLALRILGNQAEAEDVAAEALARAYARWSRLRELPYVDGWVLRVAANLAIDTLRRRGRRLMVEAAPVDDPVVLRLALSAALRSLPRRQREVIALRYLTDLGEAEVALALGIAPATVRTHVHRALVQLRGRLGTEFQENDLAVEYP